MVDKIKPLPEFGGSDSYHADHPGMQKETCSKAVRGMFRYSSPPVFLHPLGATWLQLAPLRPAPLLPLAVSAL
jgi:hypothetical protein